MDQDYQSVGFQAPRSHERIAEVIVAVTDTIGRGIEFIADQFREIRSPDDCRTPEDLRRYAATIMERQPGLANELIAFANHAEDQTK